MKTTILFGVLSSASLVYGWGSFNSIYDYDCNSAGGGCTTQGLQYWQVAGTTTSKVDSHGNAMRKIVSSVTGIGLTDGSIFNYNIGESDTSISSKAWVSSVKGEATYLQSQKVNGVHSTSVQWPADELCQHQLNCAIWLTKRYLAKDSLDMKFVMAKQPNVYLKQFIAVGSNGGTDCPSNAHVDNNEAGVHSSAPGHCGISVAVAIAAAKIRKDGTNYGTTGTSDPKPCEWLNIRTEAIPDTADYELRMDNLAKKRDCKGTTVDSYYIISSTTGICPYFTGATSVTCASGTKIRCNLTTGTYSCL